MVRAVKTLVVSVIRRKIAMTALFIGAHFFADRCAGLGARCGARGKNRWLYE